MVLNLFIQLADACIALTKDLRVSCSFTIF
jgi:hypothetical protein